MHTVLVTGASGFIGRNLCVHLNNRSNINVLTAGRDTPSHTLCAAVAAADTIVHLAGVNRPSDASEFEHINIGYTETLAKMLSGSTRPRRVIFASSIQADNDSAYGLSKRRAEECLRTLTKNDAVAVSVFRLKNVFGKWCKPNYNSVVATFCHNVARALPIEIHDPSHSVELVFIDDITRAIEQELSLPLIAHEFNFRGAEIPVTTVSLGQLADTILNFRDIRTSLLIPDFSSAFLRQLYATYLSYVDPKVAAYKLQARHDTRGSLAEFIKSDTAGQIFVSRTRPGVTRGNHFHHTKTEKFLVLEGEGLIRLREIGSDTTIEHRASGVDYSVVDIPPGYTHSITNVGASDLVTLFWASENFNPNLADTYPLPVMIDDGTSATNRGNAA